MDVDLSMQVCPTAAVHNLSEKCFPDFNCQHSSTPHDVATASHSLCLD